MDRDKRWERVKLAYDALVNAKGPTSMDAVALMEENYANGITDEFIKPSVITGEDGEPLTTIQDGDVVICFQFPYGPLPRDHRSAHAA